MPNQFGVPEISVQVVAEKRFNQEKFILVDVREERELTIASLGEDVVHIPMSNIASHRLEAFPEAITTNKDAEIVVFCHHGGRSAQVAAFLRREGWTNVLNMEGGIDAYSFAIDHSIQRY